MRMYDVTSRDIEKITNHFREFLALCKEELGLKKLPKIQWDSGADTKQTSFGCFNNDDQSIRVSIKDRHPNDIMRTLAHELVHYKQYLDGKIEADSGETGSPIENEANAIAGIIMRKFNHTHPKAFDIRTLDESLIRKYNKL